VLAGESDVRLAFIKALALAKVYYNCAHKGWEVALKENDAHSVKFFLKCIEEVVCRFCSYSFSKFALWPHR